MEHQRDYIENQIDQLGKTLGEILAIFLKLKSEGKAIKGAQIAQDLLMSTIDIDLHELVQVDKHRLKSYVQRMGWQINHIEDLVDLFHEFSQLPHSDVAKASIYAQTGVNLLDIADDMSEEFSFKRETLKSMLKEMI